MGFQVTDISLEDYIAVKPKFAVYVPHTAGRYQKRRFRKALCPIVERCAAARCQQHSGMARQGREQLGGCNALRGRFSSTQCSAAAQGRQELYAAEPERSNTESQPAPCTPTAGSHDRGRVPEHAHSGALTPSALARPLERAARIPAVAMDFDFGAEWHSAWPTLSARITRRRSAGGGLCSWMHGRALMVMLRDVLCYCRLACSLMQHGRNNGKKLMAVSEIAQCGIVLQTSSSVHVAGFQGCLQVV